MMIKAHSTEYASHEVAQTPEKRGHRGPGTFSTTGGAGGGDEGRQGPVKDVDVGDHPGFRLFGLANDRTFGIRDPGTRPQREKVRCRRTRKERREQPRSA